MSVRDFTVYLLLSSGALGLCFSNVGVSGLFFTTPGSRIGVLRPRETTSFADFSKPKGGPGSECGRTLRETLHAPGASESLVTAGFVLKLVTLVSSVVYNVCLSTSFPKLWTVGFSFLVSGFSGCSSLANPSECVVLLFRAPF